MKKLWISFAIVFFGSFAVLGWIGTRIYQEMPPIPNRVVDSSGNVVLGEGDIEKGQNVWQALGGMEVGSVWGPGSYIAPDWTADWLHRETTFVLDQWSGAEYGKPYSQLATEDQAKLRGRLEEMYRRNGYDAATSTLHVDAVRARAFEACLQHFSDVFMKGNADYAIPPGSVSSPERMRQFAGFIFWTAWSAAADRPGDRVRGGIFGRRMDEHPQ
jgi:nitric oxide reductase subunit B